MYWVYILRGASGRHYIGQTSDLVARLEQHRNGQTYTTRRLGGTIELVASFSFHTRAEAMAIERKLKAWKNPTKGIEYLRDGCV